MYVCFSLKFRAPIAFLSKSFCCQLQVLPHRTCAAMILLFQVLFAKCKLKDISR